MNKTDLEKEIKKKLEEYEGKKEFNSYFAVGFKLSTALLGALVTVFLGWKVNGESPLWMPNAALICGAIIAIMNTLDPFFGFSARWTIYKAVCRKLIFLQSEFEREKGETFDKYELRLQEIIYEAKMETVGLNKERK